MPENAGESSYAQSQPDRPPVSGQPAQDGAPHSQSGAGEERRPVGHQGGHPGGHQGGGGTL